MTPTTKTYDRQTATFLARVGENMPELQSDIMQRWIENPKAMQKALHRVFLDLAPREFKTWKTIKLGTHKSEEDLSKAITLGGFRITNDAADILKEVVVAETETEIELVLVTVAELGFTDNARCYEIYDRAKELGLDLVPAEGGPQLRLAYTDQPMDELIVMAMGPIVDSDRTFNVFGIGHSDDGQWLITETGDPQSMLSLSLRLVFARRK